MTVCPAPSSGSATLRAGNYTITLVAACAFAVQMLLDPGAQYLSSLVLEKWSWPGLFGHMWLHMTALHLLENLATLWIFGYAVCPLLGNVAYVLAYVIMGVAGGMAHVVCDGRPAIGASGAVMGIFGMYVVICFGRFGRLGPWLVLAWFLATLGRGSSAGSPGPTSTTPAPLSAAWCWPFAS